MILVAGPLVCLIPDLTVTFAKKIFFKNPADFILDQMTTEQTEFKKSVNFKNKRSSKLPKQDDDEFTNLKKNSDIENNQIYDTAVNSDRIKIKNKKPSPSGGKKANKTAVVAKAAKKQPEDEYYDEEGYGEYYDDEYYGEEYGEEAPAKSEAKYRKSTKKQLKASVGGPPSPKPGLIKNKIVDDSISSVSPAI